MPYDTWQISIIYSTKIQQFILLCKFLFDNHLLAVYDVDAKDRGVLIVTGTPSSTVGKHATAIDLHYAAIDIVFETATSSLDIRWKMQK